MKTWQAMTVVALTGCSPRPHAELASTAGGADASAVDRAVATIREQDLARHVEILASDAFGGRFPGTAAESKTLGYLAAGFAKAGLHPAVDGTFTQEVAMVRVAVQPGASATFTVQGGGDETQHSLRWGDDLLVHSGRAEASVSLTDAPVVFAGHGIVAPEHGWDDYGSLDVTGAVVVVLPGEPAREGDATFFEGRALTHHGTTAAKVERASERGAVGVLVVRADGEGGLAWSTLKAGAQAPKYRLPATDDVPAPTVQGLVEAASFAALLEGGAPSLAGLREASARAGFSARALPMTLDLSLRSTVEPGTSHNLIGFLPGRERPEEVVLYTAHWDHVGTNGEHVFNGAVDNATGTAALLELAEAYAALPEPPARSVVFMATTAEEQGLLGSFHYAAHPVFALASTVGVINMDALFPFGAFDSMTVVALGASELDDYLRDAAEAVGRTLHADPMPELGAFFRSDHYPFAVQGVPATFAVGGPSPDAAPDPKVMARFDDYLRNRYHQPADEYDPDTWDLAGIRQDVEVYFRMGYALASTTAMPNWREGHAFRAKRDAMLSDR